MKCLGTIIPKEEWNVGLLMILIQNNRRDDVKKLLCHGVRPAGDLWSPLHEAAIQGNAGIAEILIAAGADVNFHVDNCSSPLGAAINEISFNHHGNHHIRCAKVLIANGARLYTIFDRQKLSKAKKYGLFDFERQVLKCRSACIAFYHLRSHLRVGGKYMVRELAVAIWSTRHDERW